MEDFLRQNQESKLRMERMVAELYQKMEEDIRQLSRETESLKLRRGSFDENHSEDLEEKVHLNVGGRTFIKRRHYFLHGEEWNIFSKLMAKKWENWFFRDKKGRIYLEYEFEDIERFFKCSERSQLSLEAKLMCLLNPCLRKAFPPPFESPIRSGEILSDPWIYQAINHALAQNLPKKDYLLRNIFSFSRNPFFMPSTPFEKVYQTGHPILILLSTSCGRLYCCFSDQSIEGRSVLNSENTFCAQLEPDVHLFRATTKGLPKSKSVSCSKLFPFSFLGMDESITASNPFNPEEPACIRFSSRNGSFYFPSLISTTLHLLRENTWLQIKDISAYHIDYPIQKEQKPASALTLKANTLSPLTAAINQELSDVLYPLRDNVQQYRQGIEMDSEKFFKEVNEVESFFTNYWRGLGLKNKEFKKPEGNRGSKKDVQADLEKALRRMNGLKAEIQAHQASFNALSKQDQLLNDPIAYFNAEGEIVCILKSTIRELAPESQLAIRLSGKWREQESDVDEEGNLYIDIDASIFKEIIRGFREAKMMGAKPLSISVPKDRTMESMKEVLDYLQITSYQLVV